MKRAVMMLGILLLAGLLTACGSKAEPPELTPPAEAQDSSQGAANAAPAEAGGAERQIQLTTETGSIIIFQLNDSPAANALYEQLPLEATVEDYAESEKIFYLPEELTIGDTPLAQGPAGTLAYYEPWGNAAIFYEECGEASGLYALGEAVSGQEYLTELSGDIRLTAVSDEAQSAEPAPHPAQAAPVDTPSAAPVERAEAAPDQSILPPAAPAQEASSTAAPTEEIAQAIPQEAPPAIAAPEETPPAAIADEPRNMRISAGGHHFAVTLYDNEATQALRERLPLSLHMSELNGNEKYHYLKAALPTNAVQPAGIQAGDLMLYGSDCLVLFYQDFATTYSYTPLGRVEDADGLQEALGDGAVEVTFALE